MTKIIKIMVLSLMIMGFIFVVNKSQIFHDQPNSRDIICNFYSRIIGRK